MIHKSIKPMLLHKSFDVPAGEYLHQLKYDGIRCLLSFDADRGIKLYTRHENECTRQYTEMQNVRLDAQNALLDGELIVLDAEAKPCFESVMKRFMSNGEHAVQRNMKALPAHFVAFDILYLNGERTIDLPLEQRLALLPDVIIASNEISVIKSFENGEELFQATKNMGLEGIVSKKKASRYKLDHRSDNWLKVKNYQYAKVAISGIRKEKFGWSLTKDGKYVGVMEFVPPDARKAFYQIAKRIKRDENKNWIYLDPVIQCEVQFQCYTKSGLMRSPSFVKFVLND